MPSIIERIEAWFVRFELPCPIKLGHMVIASRDYAITRVTTSDGISGMSYCLSRGAPVDVTLVDLVAASALGKPAEAIDDVLSRLRRATVSIGPCGILGRAMSMLDVALWDIEAQRHGKPLWSLLGPAAQASTDVLLVEGYQRQGETTDDFVDRLARRVDAGCSWLKLANIPDVDLMTERLVRLRAAVGPAARIVVDVAWAWDDPDFAINTIRRWEDVDLAWIEDPTIVSRVGYFSRLRKETRTPVAAGDEVSDVDRLRDLVAAGALDILRFDALTGGGVSGFVAAQTLAAGQEMRLSPHIYPELNRHFATAFPDVGPVESYGDTAEFDLSCRFVQVTSGELSFRRVTTPTAPGIGYDFDWDVLESATVRKSEAKLR